MEKARVAAVGVGIVRLADRWFQCRSPIECIPIVDAIAVQRSFHPIIHLTDRIMSQFDRPAESIIPLHYADTRLVPLDGSAFLLHSYRSFVPEAAWYPLNTCQCQSKLCEKVIGPLVRTSLGIGGTNDASKNGYVRDKRRQGGARGDRINIALETESYRFGREEP